MLTLRMPQSQAQPGAAFASLIAQAIPMGCKPVGYEPKAQLSIDFDSRMLNPDCATTNADPGDEFCVAGDEHTGQGTVALGAALYLRANDQLLGVDGEQIYLRAQSATVLAFLVQHLGQLVSRDQLIDHVWPDVAVTDDSLTQCISDVRRALGDRDRTILRTVPKRGFVLEGEHVSERVVLPGGEARSQLSDAQIRAMGSGIVVAVLDPDQRLEPAVMSLVSAGTALRLSDPLGAETHLLFSDIDQALETCRPWADELGLAVSVGYGGAASEPLRNMARPGEILTTLEIRDRAQFHPALGFEDLGRIGLSETRAFRLMARDNARSKQVLRLDQPLLPTISVLPLQNFDQDAPDIMGTVFADVVSAALGAAEEINVTSRLSTIALAREKADMEQIARLLKSEFVLSGFFVDRNGVLILNLEFSEVARQRVLWSYRLEVSTQDLLGEFAAVHEIVAKIRRTILINEVRRANVQPLESLANYSLMFAAVGLMHRLSPYDFARSRELLDALRARVPNHPVPLAWTARWHLLRVVQGWSNDAEADAQAALSCTGRALDLDPESVLALACEGHVLTNILHRLDEAEDRYNLALTANPNDANARSLRGMLLAFQGRGEDGVRDTERALHLTPLDPHRFFYLAMAAGACLTPGDYAQAERHAIASLRLNRTHLSTLRMLVVAQQKLGKHEEASRSAAELMRLQPDLKVSSWLRSSPSADFETGRLFAQALKDAGVPD